jgi:hypothetical protein
MGNGKLNIIANLHEKLANHVKFSFGANGEWQRWPCII